MARDPIPVRSSREAFGPGSRWRERWAKRGKKVKGEERPWLPAKRKKTPVPAPSLGPRIPQPEGKFGAAPEIPSPRGAPAAGKWLGGLGPEPAAAAPPREWLGGLEGVGIPEPGEGAAPLPALETTAVAPTISTDDLLATSALDAIGEEFDAATFIESMRPYYPSPYGTEAEEPASLAENLLYGGARDPYGVGGMEVGLPEGIETPAAMAWAQKMLMNVLWHFGLALNLEAPKVPERAIFTNAQSGQWWLTPGLGALGSGAGYSPYESAFLASLTGPDDPFEQATDAMTRFANTSPEDFKRYWQEGEIGYTFAKHPERLEPFREAIASGMTYDEAIRNPEFGADIPLELGMNIVIDPMWIVPQKWQRVIWPAGTLAAEAAGAVVVPVIGKVWRKTVGKTRLGAWLVATSKKSLVNRATSASTDAMGEAALRVPGFVDEGPLVVWNKLYGGSREFDDVLSPGMVRWWTAYSDDLATDGIADAEGLIARWVPSAADVLDDEAVRAARLANPQIDQFLLRQAASRRAAHKLGLTPVDEMGALARNLDYWMGVAKEQMLAVNPAYILTNSLDNTFKGLGFGHYVNPLDFGSRRSINEMLAGYSVVLPDSVASTMVDDVLGGTQRLRTDRLPYPLGRPSETVDWLSNLFGRDLREKIPLLAEIAPTRPTTIELALGLSEPPSAVARGLDAMTWAQLSEMGLGTSSRVESLARMQIFADVFSKQIESVGRPNLVRVAQGTTGLTDEMVGAMSNPSLTRSVQDILDLQVLMNGPGDVPAVSWSSLLSKGPDQGIFGVLGKNLDAWQVGALVRSDPVAATNEVLVWADDLFDETRRWLDLTETFADFEEEVMVPHRAKWVAAKAEDLATFSRQWGDDLLGKVKRAAVADPDRASVFWLRYWDDRGAMNRRTWQGFRELAVSDIPMLSDDVTKAMQKYRSWCPEEMVGKVRVEEMGLWGEQLAEWRRPVDENWIEAWQAFLRNPTDESLAILNGAMDEFKGMADEASGLANTLRNGYWTKKRAGKMPDITLDEMRDAVGKFWYNSYFEPGPEVLNKAIRDMGGEVVEEAVGKFTSVEWTGGTGGKIVTGATDDLTGMDLFAFLPSEGKLVGGESAGVGHLNLYGELAGDVSEGATFEAVREARIVRAGVYGEPGYLDIISTTKEAASEDVLAALKAIRESGAVPGDIKVYCGPTLGKDLMPLDDAIAHLEGLVEEAAPKATWLNRGEGAFLVEAEAGDLSAIRSGLYDPTSGELIFSNERLPHEIAAEKMWGKLEELQNRRAVRIRTQFEEVGHPMLMLDPETGDTVQGIREVLGCVDAMLRDGVPGAQEVMSTAGYSRGLGFGGTLDEVRDQLVKALQDLGEEMPGVVAGRVAGPGLMGEEYVGRLGAMEEAGRAATGVQWVGGKPFDIRGGPGKWIEIAPEQAERIVAAEAGAVEAMAGRPPSMQQLQDWLEKGNITQEGYEEWVARINQIEFEQDMQFELIRRTREKLDDIRPRLDAWQEAIRGSWDETVPVATLSQTQKQAAGEGLGKAAKAWAKELEQAQIVATSRVQEVLFDYTHGTKNYEEVMGYFFPFVKWQLRNPGTYMKLVAERPHLLSMMLRYVDASEQLREQKHLTRRFEGTMPLPGAGWLQEKGVLPGGYWAMDPRSIASISGQFREQFRSPAEMEMEGVQRWANIGARAPEYLGMHPWPPLQVPLERAGVYGQRAPFGVLGATGRAVPGLRRVEEQIGEARVPGSEWLRKYWTNQYITFMEAEGLISSQESAEAQFNPESPIYQQALAESRKISDISSAVRAMIPFSLKYARPGEMDVRERREMLKGLPEGESRAAYLRSISPGSRAYGRAVASVEQPEYAAWQGRRDTIFAKYEQMLGEIPPWHPRAGELSRAMWTEIDALGEAPEAVAERGYPMEEEDKDTFLFQLEQQRPKVQDFTGPGGEIDWEEYAAATEQYVQVVVEPSGVGQEEYDAFRWRYLSPLEMAWELRERELGEGWDRYGELRGLQIPERPDVSVAGRGRGYELPGPDTLMGAAREAPQEMLPWLTEEAGVRTREGWAPGEVAEWARGKKLPYEVVQRMLGEEGYGPRRVEEMMPQVEKMRPWLKGLEPGAEEWGGIEPWREKEMPGMFRQTQEAGLRGRFYSLSSAQKRSVTRMLGLEEDADVSEYIDELATTGGRGFRGLESAMRGLEPPTPEDRRQAELDLLRYHKGEGEWTNLLEEHYGDPTSGRSRFWTALDEVVLSDVAYDDPVLAAVLSGDVRGILDLSDEQYQEALEYFEKNRKLLVDEEAMALAEENPGWFEVAKRQNAGVKAFTLPREVQQDYMTLETPGERAEWRQENPEAWEQLTTGWNEKNQLLVQNPFYLYFYQHDKYVQWFGDVEPGMVDVESVLEDYLSAEEDMRRQEEEGGRWTDAMDRWFGDETGASSKFWDYYFATKNFLTDEYHDDPVVQAALSADVRNLLMYEAQPRLFEEALKRLRTYYDPEEAQRWSTYPELRGQATQERGEFLDIFVYDARPVEDKGAENQWWKDRTAWMQLHPVMVWFYYYDKYIKWWGESPLPEAGPISPAPPPPPSPGGGGGGGDGDGGGGGPAPPPPPPPPWQSGAGELGGAGALGPWLPQSGGTGAGAGWLG